MNRHYTTVFDFFEDQTFREWIVEDTPELRAYWQSWLLENTTQKELFNKAVLLLKYLKNSKTDAVSPALIEAEWKAFRGQSFGMEHQTKSPFRAIFTSPVRQIAASVFLVLGLAFGYLRGRTTEIVAAYGKPRTLSLPDGSVVTLNAHSTLRYPATWWLHRQRTVWLEGNALFRVKKNKKTFTVYTNAFDIKVLGTVFEVNTRLAAQRVYLKEGSIALQLHKTKQTVRLKPTELWQFQQTGTIKSYPNYRGTDWTEGKLTFENTPLSEVFTQIQQLYGLTIQASPTISRKLFTASLPYDSTPTTILVAITQSFALKSRQVDSKTIEVYD